MHFKSETGTSTECWDFNTENVEEAEGPPSNISSYSNSDAQSECFP